MMHDRCKDSVDGCIDELGGHSVVCNLRAFGAIGSAEMEVRVSQE